MSEYLKMLSEIERDNKVKEISKLQNNSLLVIDKAIKDMEQEIKLTNSSLRKQYIKSKTKVLANKLENEVSEQFQGLSNNLLKKHKQFLEEVSWQSGYKLQNFDKVFSKVPQGIQRILQNGSLYKDGVGLSNRIYKNSLFVCNDVDQFVKQGLLQGHSAAKMSENLKQYVTPLSRKLWDNGKIRQLLGDGYANKYKHLEYNSLRLARTTITHAHTLGDKIAAKNTPFLEEFRWNSVFAHGRTCQECKDRHGTIYTIKELPYDHPNGLCYNEPYLDEDLEHYSNKIKSWCEGEDVKELDNFALNTLGMKPEKLNGIISNVDNASITSNDEFRIAKNLRNREYRRFETSSDIEEMQDKYMDWANNLDDDLKRSVEKYTGNSYKAVNANLRGTYEHTKPDWVDDMVDKLTKVLDNVEVKEDIATYRGMNVHHLDETFKKFYNKNGEFKFDKTDEILKEAKDKLVGTIVEDKGFVSTTIKESSTFNRNVNMKINVPKGAKGGYIEDLSKFSDEKEFLLQRDSKFQIIDAHMSTDTLELEVDLIEQAGKKFY